MSAEAIVDVKNVGKTYDERRRGPGGGQRSASSRRAQHVAGPQRLRQNDASKNHRWADSAQSRRDLGERQKGRRAGARARVCISRFRAAAMGQRFAQRRFWFGTTRHAQRRARSNRPQIHRGGRAQSFRDPAIRTSSRAGCASESGSPAPSLSMRKSSSWMSHFLPCEEQMRRNFQEELMDLLKTPEGDRNCRQPQYRRGGLSLGSDRAPVGTSGNRIKKSSSPTLTARAEVPDEIRRDKNYLDAVDEIWQILNTTFEEAGMVEYWNDAFEAQHSITPILQSLR